VRLDGADICQWDKTLLGPSMGYLPQDVELFDGSIAQNIARFGEANSELIVAAAQLAGVHEMILRLPQGYDTRLGASGHQLSGGQRQRIGLARAVYNNPAFIVLDEPNANLDDAGEMALLKAINALRAQGQTVVLISHRPTLLGVVNKVLLINEGAVQAFGPREQVFANLRQANMLKSVPVAPAAVSEPPVETHQTPREALS
jgi:ATP-binding cassette subfamily C exporter for protease/lipase